MQVMLNWSIQNRQTTMTVFYAHLGQVPCQTRVIKESFSNGRVSSPPEEDMALVGRFFSNYHRFSRFFIKKIISHVTIYFVINALRVVFFLKELLNQLNYSLRQNSFGHFKTRVLKTLLVLFPYQINLNSI